MQHEGHELHFALRLSLVLQALLIHFTAVLRYFTPFQTLPVHSLLKQKADQMNACSDRQLSHVHRLLRILGEEGSLANFTLNRTTTRVLLFTDRDATIDGSRILPDVVVYRPILHGTTVLRQAMAFDR